MALPVTSRLAQQRRRTLQNTERLAARNQLSDSAKWMPTSTGLVSKSSIYSPDGHSNGDSNGDSLGDSLRDSFRDSYRDTYFSVGSDSTGPKLKNPRPKSTGFEELDQPSILITAVDAPPVPRSPLDTVDWTQQDESIIPNEKASNVGSDNGNRLTANFSLGTKLSRGSLKGDSESKPPSTGNQKSSTPPNQDSVGPRLPRVNSDTSISSVAFKLPKVNSDTSISSVALELPRVHSDTSISSLTPNFPRINSETSISSLAPKLPRVDSGDSIVSSGGLKTPGSGTRTPKAVSWDNANVKDPEPSPPKPSRTQSGDFSANKAAYRKSQRHSKDYINSAGQLKERLETLEEQRWRQNTLRGHTVSEARARREKAGKGIAKRIWDVERVLFQGIRLPCHATGRSSRLPSLTARVMGRSTRLLRGG
ncbi:hypothetical protein K432DRAFT_43496 [Lepidopterella palustris CBS 459.81]|uniref:Uncharacterized protein n=1 Tax=Lepidopterella palustris CBS 459.81 TaxID=1314670 RepID=A0A8E2EB09_9PEZI|nr:hypothetical protein K432DRAFT_43496 [Lepidopterella palustris CBS 459.81]